MPIVSGISGQYRQLNYQHDSSGNYFLLYLKRQFLILLITELDVSLSPN
ncbi:MAG: hypothetical protein ACTS8R_02505 [Arsenophonus sp. NC-QC1-MAG3]